MGDLKISASIGQSVNDWQRAYRKYTEGLVAEFLKETGLSASQVQICAKQELTSRGLELKIWIEERKP